MKNAAIALAIVVAFLSSGCEEERPKADGDITYYQCTPKPLESGTPGECAEVSKESLDRQDREVFDKLLGMAPGGGTAGDACVFHPVMWSCVSDAWLCQCVHTTTGPDCVCVEVKET